MTHLEPFRFHVTPELVSQSSSRPVHDGDCYPLLVWAQSHPSAPITALILAGEPFSAAVTSYIVLTNASALGRWLARADSWGDSGR